MMIVGLGAACPVPVLSNDQLFQVFVNAGFPTDNGPPSTAEKMVAIALRESGGCPVAHNPGPGEDSYGLVQINVQGNPTISQQFPDPTALYDPATNAAVAFQMWGGNDANLNTAWYLNRPGYQQQYEAYLPAALQAALDVLGSVPGGSGAMSAGLDTSGLSAGQIAVAAGLAIAAAVVLFA